LAQVGLLVVGGITAGILAVVCPPVFAAGAALAAGGGSAVISVIKNLFSLTSDLAENPSFLSSFKRKVKRTANAFSERPSCSVKTLAMSRMWPLSTNFLRP